MSFQYPTELLAWIVLLPLAGALFNGLLGRRVSRQVVYLVGCGAVLASFVAGVLLFLDLQLLVPHKRHLVQTLFTWMPVGSLAVELKLLADPLSALLVLVVTGVGFLIHLYSTEYMDHDRGAWRYFAYLNLFVFAMLLLVLGANLPVMFVGWEGVGLCSYLLIGFWFNDAANARAGRKAFIVNRIGDFGFLLGIFLIFSALGTVDFLQIDYKLIWQKVPLDITIATAATLLLFVGAMGKSAQIPLYIWLPDAMAGPTPVSALIHAATMVTAGVYMIARLNSLFMLAPTTMGIVAGIGAATALFAASIALVQNDIKKVLAYSTVSQLGYMFMGVGVGAFAAGVFHLFTHAFFKALLFLGSGAVIHAMDHAHGADDPQDIRTMGGLRKHLPITTWTFVAATLAITGVPGLSGFFSKDEILWKSLSSELGGPVLWLVGSLAAVLTAFYMTRLVILTFWGTYRGQAGTEARLHDPGWRMSVPLILLAVASVVAGYIGMPHVFHVTNYFEQWLHPVFANVELHNYHHLPVLGAQVGEAAAMAISIVLAFAGIGAAIWIYGARPALAGSLARRLRPAYLLLKGKYFVDELYDWLLIKPLRLVSRWVLFGLVDRRVIDFAVEGTARMARAAGWVLRPAHSGSTGTYLMYLAAGSLVLLWGILG